VLAQPILQTTWIADMVLIPAGPFLMGSNVRDDESPIAEVWVDAFAIDRTPVTNGQFRAFWESGMYDDPNAHCWAGLQEGYRWIRKEEMRRVPRYWYDAQWNAPDQPIVGVTWYEALAYARWAGKRLPTEAEWEFAARGGKSGEVYAWGDQFRPDSKWMANTFQGQFPIRDTAQDGFAGIAPVGQFPANPYGLQDMAGNVWEWCADWYRADYYEQLSRQKATIVNPRGPADSWDPSEPGAAKRVHRGGSFLCTDQYCTRYMIGTRGKGEHSTGTNHIGFRCVQDPKPSEPK